MDDTAGTSAHWPTALGEEASNPQQYDSPADADVWQTNIGRRERDLSIYSGAALLALGLMGPRRTRGLAFLSGAGLLYRGLTGHCHLYDALGMDSTYADSQ